MDNLNGHSAGPGQLVNCLTLARVEFCQLAELLALVRVNIVRSSRICTGKSTDCSGIT